MEKLPIIYVRGWAGPTAGIDAAVDDPFYGFNAGGTHVRVGGGGTPSFHQFEGPLLRLMTDEGYQLLVRGDQRRCLAGAAAASLPRASLWVHRFYDRAATTFGAPRARGGFPAVADAVLRHLTAPEFTIEEAARDLYDLVLAVREKTGAAKVHLVAHSMGGLVVRCMMQRTCLLEGRTPARDLVARFFTYGTPHGGIRFAVPALDWAEGALGIAGSDVFAPSRMHRYLSADDPGTDVPDGWDPQVLPSDVLDPDDVFCLVGTDPGDYAEAGGLSRTAVGPRSDGLVRIEDAHLRGAHRAYVHRSHSGPYGEVNSEEGYQNLRRFLFGRWQVRVDLVGMPRCPSGDPTRDPGGSSPVWQADVRLAVRGLPVVLSEQTAAHWCPVQLDEELPRAASAQDGTGDRAVPLATTFLLDPAAGWARDRARYTMTLRVSALAQSHHGFWFEDHLEQVPDWEDSLVVDVGPGSGDGGPQMEAAWNSQVRGPNARFDPITLGVPVDQRSSSTASRTGGAGVHEMALPEAARALPVLGLRARLRISVVERTTGPGGARPGGQGQSRPGGQDRGLPGGLGRGLPGGLGRGVGVPSPRDAR